MYLTANQTAQLQTTYRSAIAAAYLVNWSFQTVNRLFLLPTVDHLWGNACDWQETLMKGYQAVNYWFTTDSELKTFLVDLFILLPFFLGKLVSEKTDRYVNQCLQPLSEPVNQTQAMIDRDLDELEILVNQLSEPTEYATLESAGALPRLERVSTGLQAVQPTKAQLDTLADMGAIVVGYDTAVDDSYSVTLVNQSLQPTKDEFTAG